MIALAKPRHAGSAAGHESAGQDRISPATLMPNGVAAEQHGCLKQKGLAVDRRRAGALGSWVEAVEGGASPSAGCGSQSVERHTHGFGLAASPVSFGLAATLEALRACSATGTPVSPVLLDAAIECLVRVASEDLLRKERNRLIRAAAQLLQEDTDWARARKLRQETKVMWRTWNILKTRVPRSTDPTARDLLHAAALASNLPDSDRQFYRVLREGAG
ncbi:hypothetical protein [Rhodanobacter sp. Root179]|uniref:hypothetical protein n=1 Tax=Rhodanobacter sp. Root179 TaxID=1736482 RepID=UPI0012F85B97|nr:hypothetical protein [Rhodanobacter sp. Root179]